jgi:hypothetical protein
MRTFPGVWVVPGGGVDASDASPMEAAIRELKEETGLVFDARGDVVCETSSSSSPVHVVDGAAPARLIGIWESCYPPTADEAFALLNSHASAVVPASRHGTASTGDAPAPTHASPPVPRKKELRSHIVMYYLMTLAASSSTRSAPSASGIEAAEGSSLRSEAQQLTPPPHVTLQLDETDVAAWCSVRIVPFGGSGSDTGTYRGVGGAPNVRVEIVPRFVQVGNDGPVVKAEVIGGDAEMSPLAVADVAPRDVALHHHQMAGEVSEGTAYMLARAVDALG